jgi:type IV secretory pathway VirJ component
MIVLVSALVIYALITSIGASPAYALYVGRYVSVKVAESKGAPRGVVIFFSGRQGLTRLDRAEAEAIANDGTLVAEIDTRTYLRRLDKDNEKCHRVALDAEILSRFLQRDRHLPNYLTPVVAGVGEGGTLAELILAEAPPNTIARAVSIDPSDSIESRRPICSDLPTTRRRNGFGYGAPKKLNAPWTVVFTRDAKKSDRNYITKLHGDGAPIDLRELVSNETLADALRSLIAAHLVAVPSPKAPKIPEAPKIDISSLPLAVLTVNHPSKVMAIVLSGDGGWRDLDKTVAEDLQHKGVPVVGLDSLRYFWSKKTPQQIASVVAGLIEMFTARWHTNKVALVGYSFGADVMPFVYNRLPPNVRGEVVILALMGLSKSADFQISVGGWLGEPPGPDALPVVPEADKVPSSLMQCFYGENESDTACPTLQKRGVETYRRSGGHHYDGNYGALADLIMAGIKERTGITVSLK